MSLCNFVTLLLTLHIFSLLCYISVNSDKSYISGLLYISVNSVVVYLCQLSSKSLSICQLCSPSILFSTLFTVLVYLCQLCCILCCIYLPPSPVPGSCSPDCCLPPTADYPGVCVTGQSDRRRPMSGRHRVPSANQEPAGPERSNGGQCRVCCVDLGTHEVIVYDGGVTGRGLEWC